MGRYPSKSKPTPASSRCESPDPPLTRFATGAVRGPQTSIARYDLISPIALKAVAETYGEGSLKYGDSNWQKGIGSKNLLNHALTHIQQYQIGDTSEPHLAHAIWNLMTIIHFQATRPELIELPYAPGFDPHTDPTNK